MQVAEDSPDYSDSCMIALYPPAQLAQTLTVQDGLPPAEMHVTVAYAGKAADVDREALTAAAKAVADRPPVQAQISGHARFTGGTKGDVIVALIDSADLEDLRRDLINALAEQDVTIPRDHGFTGHCTLTYIGADDPSPVDRLTPIQVTFGSITVVHGSDRTDLPFTGTEPPIAALAREAYAAGWALSGGPMTDRVRAGATAAAHLAIENSSDPGILEVTLHLGHLEGVWATVYERRENLIADHTVAVTRVWKTAFHELDVSKAITRYRAVAFPAESYDYMINHGGYAGANGLEVLTAEAADPMLATRRAEAKSAALGLLSGIHYTDTYPKLQARVADALRAARAEGHISAQHIHAEHKPQEAAGDDTWAVEFDNYYEQLGLLDDWPALADSWIQNLVDGASTDLGNTLAAMTRDGASYEDMLAAADDLLGSGDVRAVSTLLDYAMSDAITQASVDLYASEGVAQYDILTAGDSRVCQRCLDLEADNPYPVTQSPGVPAHPGCRCAAAPSASSIRALMPQEV